MKQSPRRRAGLSAVTADKASAHAAVRPLMRMSVRRDMGPPRFPNIAEPMIWAPRLRYMRKRAAVLLIAAVALSSCSGSSPTPTRLVGAHQVALVVPSEWKTHVEHGDTCPPTDPKTVQFFAPLHGPVGSCAVPTGASWPAQQSVSIYTRLSGPAPHRTPSGTVHGLPYYIAEVRQSGPGVAMGLSVPRADVSFLVGAPDHDTALALLNTVRFVPTGTHLR